MKKENLQEITISQARENLSDLISEVAFGKKSLILKRRGKKIVAIIPIEEFEKARK